MLESRSDGWTADGLSNGVGLRGAGSVTEVVVAGRGGVAVDAGAVSLNVTVVGAFGSGYATVYPCGGVVPGASNLNFVAGQTVPNAVISKVGVGGKVCVYTSGATHLIVDVNGFFGSGSGKSSLRLAPPLVIDAVDVDRGLAMLDGCIGEARGG